MMNTIGIIGGTGQMGSMFEREFKKIGKRVLISDETTISSEKKLVHESDVVIISVPLGVSAQVIKRIKPWLHEDQLLSDFTSVKNKVIPAMLETDASIISCHPMFGLVGEITGQNIVILPVREGKYLQKYRRLYQQLGLNVVTMKDW
ncbi:MAG: prephenate dehydrogenase/arogenate dehydrogenase family protein, partial [Proteobacteria bacterium]|nr:prephenate dehydrogenase/arogenate dehydrogenase family protein [Pseudomonadota bacterium]